MPLMLTLNLTSLFQVARGVEAVLLRGVRQDLPGALHAQGAQQVGLK